MMWDCVGRPVSTATTTALLLAFRSWQAGRSAVAEVYFAAALARDESPRSLLEYGRFLAGSGNVDQLPRALTPLTEAWERAKQLGNASFRVEACQAIAVVHRELGNLAAAKQFQQLAIRAEMEGAQETSDQSRLGAGQDDLNRGDTATALASFQAVQSREWIGSAQYHSGVSLVRLGRMDEAIRSFHAARKSFRVDRDVRGQVRALEAIALAHFIRGASLIAVCFAGEALTLARRLTTSRPDLPRRLEQLRDDLRHSARTQSGTPICN